MFQETKATLAALDPRSDTCALICTVFLDDMSLLQISIQECGHSDTETWNAAPALIKSYPGDFETRSIRVRRIVWTALTEM